MTATAECHNGAMTAPWRVLDADSSSVERLVQAMRLPSIVARLMVARGLSDPAQAERYLVPRLADLSSPAEMADLQPAVERLAAAIKRGEAIGIFGDYDVDGVTSAAIVGDYLVRCGAEVSLRVARRDEGYGFGPGQASEMADRGCRVLVLTDCGTADHDGVALARTRGLEVIAIDHHRVAGEGWPGLALINPHRSDCGFAYKGLCSAGLAFYVMAALRRVLDRAGPLGGPAGMPGPGRARHVGGCCPAGRRESDLGRARSGGAGEYDATWSARVAAVVRARRQDVDQ